MSHQSLYDEHHLLTPQQSQQDIQHSAMRLSDLGKELLRTELPEISIFNSIPATDKILLTELKAKVGTHAEIGFNQAMQQKWVGIEKISGETIVFRKVDSVTDTIRPMLQAIADSNADALSETEKKALSKRKLSNIQSWKTFRLTKGPKFALERKKPATDLTHEMILKGTWKDQDFKEYNFNALGIWPQGGHLHPLLKVRTQFRKIFTSMGFEEMPTNNYVESSFWNFDALFQPQQHPARDAHDTFFLTSTHASI